MKVTYSYFDGNEDEGLEVLLLKNYLKFFLIQSANLLKLNGLTAF